LADAVDSASANPETLVFFDGECQRVIDRWLAAREADPSTNALFTNQLGTRLKRSGIYRAVTESAEAVGLQDPREYS